MWFGAETTFLCDDATGWKNLAVAVAGLDKTYTINLAGHASSADNDDAADLVEFWNDAESAKSDRYYDQSSAWADFRSACYTEQATAVATLATTIDVPWAHFQADLYAAKRDWWNGIQSDYLTWVAETNQEHEDYQAAVGTDYIDLVALSTAADVAYITAMAGAEETRQIAQATAGESYVHSMAGARETYLVGMSQASRDLAAGGEQSTHDSTVAAAADTYRADAAEAKGDRRVDSAQADKDYTDAIHGETGAARTWTSDRAAAVEAFSIAESTARADRESTLATLRGVYLTLEAQKYAAALDALATTSATPWATLAADEAAAEYDRLAEILSEEALFDIAAATATRDSQIAQATATETLTTAESSAQAAWQVAAADAACDQATAQGTAESENPEAAAELPGPVGPSPPPEPTGASLRPMSPIGTPLSDWPYPSSLSSVFSPEALDVTPRDVSLGGRQEKATAPLYPRSRGGSTSSWGYRQRNLLPVEDSVPSEGQLVIRTWVQRIFGRVMSNSVPVRPSEVIRGLPDPPVLLMDEEEVQKIEKTLEAADKAADLAAAAKEALDAIRDGGTPQMPAGDDFDAGEPFPDGWPEDAPERLKELVEEYRQLEKQIEWQEVKLLELKRASHEQKKRKGIGEGYILTKSSGLLASLYTKLGELRSEIKKQVDEILEE